MRLASTSVHVDIDRDDTFSVLKISQFTGKCKDKSQLTGNYKDKSQLIGKDKDKSQLTGKDKVKSQLTGRQNNTNCH